MRYDPLYLVRPSSSTFFSAPRARSFDLSLFFFFFPFLLRFALVPIVKDRSNTRECVFLTITFTCPCLSMLVVQLYHSSGGPTSYAVLHGKWYGNFFFTNHVVSRMAVPLLRQQRYIRLRKNRCNRLTRVGTCGFCTFGSRWRKIFQPLV